MKTFQSIELPENIWMKLRLVTMHHKKEQNEGMGGRKCWKTLFGYCSECHPVQTVDCLFIDADFRTVLIRALYPRKSYMTDLHRICVTGDRGQNYHIDQSAGLILIDWFIYSNMFKKATQIIATEDEQDSQAPRALIAALIA